MGQTGERTVSVRIRKGLALISIVAALLSGVAAQAQDTEAVLPDADLDPALSQALTDIDALIIATQVTTRCALYDSSLAYLSPLSETAARLRIEEMQAMLTSRIPDLPDRLSAMREEANTVDCGNDGLVPFLQFAEQVAADVTAIALRAWAEIDIDSCNYFADDEFLAAADRAQAAASDLPEASDASRRAYLEGRAQAWIGLFADNCYNLTFDPTLTLPGRIALALPSGEA